MANFHSNLTQLTPNNPYFERFTPRKARAFWIMTDDPFFSKKSYTKCPYFCSPVSTPSLLYSSQPPGKQNNIDEYHNIPWPELWVRPATKITSLFRHAVVKRLPTTDLHDWKLMTQSFTTEEWCQTNTNTYRPYA